MTKITALILFFKSLFKNFKEDARATVDLGVVLTIGIAFAALIVVAFIIWTIRDQLLPQGAWQNNSYFQGLTTAENASYNTTWVSLQNVTTGFDNATNLILVAITIFILAIAISALLLLRGR